MTKEVNIIGQVKMILTPEDGASLEKKSQIQSISRDIETQKGGIAEEVGFEARLGQHQEVEVENHTLDPLIGVVGNVI